MREKETVEGLTGEAQYQALLVEQSHIIDQLVRDNVELIAAVKMFLSDEEVKEAAGETAVNVASNLLARILEERE